MIQGNDIFLTVSKILKEMYVKKVSFLLNTFPFDIHFLLNLSEGGIQDSKGNACQKSDAQEIQTSKPASKQTSIQTLKDRTT